MCSEPLAKVPGEGRGRKYRKESVMQATGIGGWEGRGPEKGKRKWPEQEKRNILLRCQKEVYKVHGGRRGRSQNLTILSALRKGRCGGSSVPTKNKKIKKSLSFNSDTS